MAATVAATAAVEMLAVTSPFGAVTAGGATILQRIVKNAETKKSRQGCSDIVNRNSDPRLKSGKKTRVKVTTSR